MAHWGCRACGFVVRNRAAEPAYCPRCGLTIFRILPAGDGAGASSRSATPPDRTPAGPVSPRGLTLELLGPSPHEPSPRKERRRARRVQPRTAVEVNVIPHGAILVRDISAIGMLVEYEQPFKYGDTYEAELRREDQQVRLRLQVIRSTVVRTNESRTSAICYHTGFQFLEPVPPDLFTVVSELAENA